jgi:hypothetical protein
MVTRPLASFPGKAISYHSDHFLNLFQIQRVKFHRHRLPDTVYA